MQILTLPPVARTPMAPRDWPPTRLGRRAHDNTPWRPAGNLRRRLLLALITAQVALGVFALQHILPWHGGKPLELITIVLFIPLFAWVSASFWTALVGALTLWRGDCHAISYGGKDWGDSNARLQTAHTAIIMPICNEDAAKTFGAIAAMRESLAKVRSKLKAPLGKLDFFALSDSADPDVRLREAAAWRSVQEHLPPAGPRIFYRWRRNRIKKKSGNIADFCRRWGAHYRYMIVLDADSLMSGDCMLELVRLMEQNPRAGIIQTAPVAIGRETLFARIHQFANRIYGPLYFAGLHYWQLGEANYWGHNAIIRIAPFMRHCALGRLPGHGPLSGEILSHDFVEAALLRRAGWGVWIVYDLPGSYEEVPPNLDDELRRDRRWCHGNLKNSRLMLAASLHPVHRMVFLSGAAAYVSSPLWFLFLILMSVQTALSVLNPVLFAAPIFTQPFKLLPLWPEYHAQWAYGLTGVTLALLLLPKLLGAALAWRSSKKNGALMLSMLLEMLCSTLLAPVRMMFHTRYVLAAFFGFMSDWKSPLRTDAQTGWHEALQRHGAHALFGMIWITTIVLLQPSALWWLAMLAGALLLAVPLAVGLSSVRLGRLARRLKLFVIGEEIEPPQELINARRHAERLGAQEPAFTDVLHDARVNFAMQNAATQPFSVRLRTPLTLLWRVLCGEDPSARERLLLLDAAAALDWLHRHARRRFAAV